MLVKAARFVFPAELTGEVITTDRLYLVDDKAISFVGLPSFTHGFWLVPQDDQLIASQKGSVKRNVTKIVCLNDIFKASL